MRTQAKAEYSWSNEEPGHRIVPVYLLEQMSQQGERLVVSVALVPRTEESGYLALAG